MFQQQIPPRQRRRRRRHSCQSQSSSSSYSHCRRHYCHHHFSFNIIKMMLKEFTSYLFLRVLFFNFFPITISIFYKKTQKDVKQTNKTLRIIIINMCLCMMRCDADVMWVRLYYYGRRKKKRFIELIYRRLMPFIKYSKWKNKLTLSHLTTTDDDDDIDQND